MRMNGDFSVCLLIPHCECMIAVHGRWFCCLCCFFVCQLRNVIRCRVIYSIVCVCVCMYWFICSFLHSDMCLFALLITYASASPSTYFNFYFYSLTHSLNTRYAMLFYSCVCCSCIHFLSPLSPSIDLSASALLYFRIIFLLFSYSLTQSITLHRSLSIRIYIYTSLHIPNRTSTTLTVWTELASRLSLTTSNSYFFWS